MRSIFRRTRRQRGTVSRPRRQRGTVSVWVTLGMLPLTAMMGLGIDTANVVQAHNNLQNYVDSKAVAGLKEVILSPAQVIEVDDFLNVHFAAGDPDEEADLTQGAWDFEHALFEEGGAELDGVPAMVADVTEEMGFEVPLFFGGLVGKPSVRLTASATAFTGKRHIVVVQDESGSMMGDPIALAIDALEAFVTSFADQDLPGDMMGIVAFHSDAHEIRSVRALHGGGEAELIAGIQTLEAQGSTNMTDGMNLGRGAFPDDDEDLVNRILVVISDGAPNGGCGGPSDEADAAEADGIDVFSVFIGATGDPGCAEDLHRGIGRFYAAEQASDLDEILVDIVSRVPVRLVN